MLPVTVKPLVSPSCLAMPNLQGDRTPEGLLDSTKDDRHATLADLALDAVTGNFHGATGKSILVHYDPTRDAC
jgi:hypothetical protein